MVLFFSGRVGVCECVCGKGMGGKDFLLFVFIWCGGGPYESLTFDQQISSDHPDYSDPFFS